jgi:N-acetyl-gamma-glutamyl-phosphate reductase
MSNKIKAGIVGGSGYTGGELIRLLIHHPDVSISFASSRQHEGKYLWQIHKDMIGETDLQFSADIQDADVIFLCLPHGESRKWVENHQLPTETRIIDLGNDFRLDGNASGRDFTYGLPEFQREKIGSAKNIANPGCFATTIQLGLLPLAKAGLLNEVHTVGITGSTGAGQSLQETTHFTWRSNNVSAYKTLTHQHVAEIQATLKALQPKFQDGISFVPWRGSFTRGIYVSSMLNIDLPLNEVKSLYEDYYRNHPFTHVSDEPIDLKQVLNTNKCLIQLEKEGNKLVVHSAIDNLIKGASGQAVQNLNLMYGFEETAGLKLKSIVY